jgi:ParB/RepB/Spo0J family partition protein
MASKLAGAMQANRAESLARRAPAADHGPDDSAAQFEGRKKHGAAALIEIGRIIPDPDQPRKEFVAEDHEQLVASLRSTGQIQPITVRWAADAGRYMLITGERRLRAARDAGLTHLACVVHDGTLTDESRVEMQLMENACRRDLKPVEQGAAFKKLMDLRGWSQTELAAHLKIHQTTVTQALGLLTLPGPVQAVVDAGDLPRSTAYAIATKIEDPVEQLRIAARVIEEDMSRGRALQVVKEATTVRKPSKGRGAEVKAAGRKSEARAAKAPTTGPAAQQGQGGAGDSPIAPPITYVFDTDPDITLTLVVGWKRPLTRPLSRIKGDAVRWMKTPAVMADGPDVPKAAQGDDAAGAGQGSEGGADEEAADAA